MLEGLRASAAEEDSVLEGRDGFVLKGTVAPAGERWVLAGVSRVYTAKLFKGCDKSLTDAGVQFEKIVRVSQDCGFENQHYFSWHDVRNEARARICSFQMKPS